MQIYLATNKTDQLNQQSYFFDHPIEIIKCFKQGEVEKCFAKMEKALACGLYLAGFLSYEAGYAFERAFSSATAYSFPLICFGAYKRPLLPLPHLQRNKWEIKIVPPERNKNKYFKAISQIKKQLAQGNTYQVNYTFKLKFTFQGSPHSLFEQLSERQPTPYSAYIQDQQFIILSHSPELFFRKSGKNLIVKPMKGTANMMKGGHHNLQHDPKNRAENLMIVDLLRSDLGRIAKIGTVKTTSLFAVEKHPTLYQMTSTIEAKTDKNIPLLKLFSQLFPSGSVTGAPKVRTMQIIKKLEKENRNIYTGAIGLITPERDMVFNVAIRTLLLSPADHNRYQGEIGLGSGITFDSNPEKEWAECLLKSSFLTA